MNTTLDDISAVIGYSATRTLVAWCGGKWLRIPAAATPDSRLAKLLGAPVLQRLVSAWPGQRLWVPMDHGYWLDRRDSQLAHLASHGISDSDIAVHLGVSRQRVQQIRAKLAAENLIEKPARETAPENSR